MKLSHVIMAAGVAAVLCSSAIILAQYQIYGGTALDNNLRSYNMRSEFGHGLDANTRLGGTGYNTGMSATPYQVNRMLAAPSRSYAQRADTVDFYRDSALSQRSYSVPYHSTGYYDAMVRSGRNPNVNPGRAYGSPPMDARIGQGPIDGRLR